MKHPIAGALLLAVTVACGQAMNGGGTMVPAETVTALREKLTGTVNLEYIDTVMVTGLDHAPDGISAGTGDVLYLCDKSGGRILKIDTSGKILATFDDLDSRTGPAFAPSDVSAAGGIEVYVLDSGSSRVLRLDRNLREAYTVFSPTQNRNRYFDSFSRIAFDRTSGDLYLTNSDHGSIIRVDMLGGNVQTSGAFGDGKTNLLAPQGIDVSGDGTIFIADTRSGTIALQQHTGATLAMIGRGLLEAPVDVEAFSDSLFAVADRRGIVLFERDGTPLAMAGFDSEPAMLPLALTYGSGWLWVSDDLSGGILRFRIY